LGDSVANFLPEDLFSLGMSQKLAQRISSGSRVINKQNRLTGVRARRGDGTFGEAVPNEAVERVPGFDVGRGLIATVEIGTEVKILAKAMIKQIDRVTSDLRGQVTQFRQAGGNPVSVGLVGINFAEHYVSYEGEKANPTDGRRYKHPIQEAEETERRLLANAKPAFDEFLILKFKAWNEPPYHFEWVAPDALRAEYGALLTRTLRKYESRFP